MIGKTTNTQAAFGGDGTKFTLTNGLLDESGLFGVYCNAVKVFGMESWWGSDQLRFVQGFVYARLDSFYGYKVKITAGNHDGSSVIGFGCGENLYHHLYDYIGIPTTPNANLTLDGGDGYIDSMLTLPYGRIPYVKYVENQNPVLKGSVSTYECDYINLGRLANNYTEYALYSGNNYGVGTNGDQFSTGAFHTYFNIEIAVTTNANSFAIAYKANSTTY